MTNTLQKDRSIEKVGNIYISLLVEHKLYMVHISVGGRKKRSGKNGSTPEENNHSDRNLTMAVASKMYIGGRESHRALHLRNLALLVC